MSHHTFTVRVASEKDAESIAPLQWEAFQNMIPYLRPLGLQDKDGFLAHFGGRNLEIAGGEEGLNMQWLVAVIPDTQEVAAAARWERIANACEGEFEPKATSVFGGPPQVEFFNKLHLMHRSVMKDQPHFCLHILATHPSFQRKGAASALLRYMTAVSDEEKLPLYVEAAPGSVPVYEKFGWAPVDKLWLPKIPGHADDFELIMFNMRFIAVALLALASLVAAAPPNTGDAIAQDPPAGCAQLPSGTVVC
ncbi:acyl-CoA N-acyltransferase [Auricularia subglabra TFB-10046 SS5]|uniref:Acyl-CoA N-acyltransferase n=1 Tax=Auricularia subglabra (strain TFB-10046 / SS5) TaxID=717982 RepID=J0CZK8_AURST|nr:acyl-CoA N-acyltransferase [Auricularia subglabra TFB-10046 SS5]